MATPCFRRRSLRASPSQPNNPKHTKSPYVVASVSAALLVAICVIAILGSTVAEANKGRKTSERLLIVDTDAGADDALAIFEFLGAENWKTLHPEDEQISTTRVVALTTVQGNTGVQNVTRNVAKILEAAERTDIPIYEGSTKSLLITPNNEGYYGDDGFGDFLPPNPTASGVKKTHAAVALIKYSKQHAGELSLVCLGPLTNIAIAVRLDPEFLNRFRDIYILGGSVRGGGNMRPGVEFNIYMDPEAAHIVFNSAAKRAKASKLVAWESWGLQSNIPVSWRKEVLGAVQTPQVELLNQAERTVLPKMTYYRSPDGLLAAAVISETLFKTSLRSRISVSVDQSTFRGATLLDYANTTGLPENVEVLENPNEEEFKELVQRLLSTSPNSDRLMNKTPRPSGVASSA